MTLKNLIIQILENPRAYVETEALEVIYANLEKERELHTKVISKKYCPEKDYFIEVLFLEEMLTGIGKEDTSDKINERIETIIEFIENDG